MDNTSSYITFARKYRPINFSELYGQEVLTKILEYSISHKRLSQGYLLTGIRGVGKTSSARIIAKTINCTEIVIGKNNNPCEACQNCNSFNEHKHPDIIEMDAASKTSIDDVRKIIESSEYRPMLGKYKVFIIDEVHMLSKGAFNALLKTLEEPPPHVIFIFATTEVHKIPLTVISRCQRYDLRRLTFDEIFKLLEQIAIKENLKFDIDALKIIASQSDGSARDAISLLDQAASLATSNKDNLISSNILNQMLGLVATNNIIKFFSYIIANDTAGSLDLINRIYNSSGDLEKFIESLSDFIAYLMKAKTLSNYTTPIYESFMEDITGILTKSSFSHLSILWQIYRNGILDVKSSHNQLLETEILAMKSIYSNSLPSPEELINNSNTAQPQAENSDLSEMITNFLKYLRSKNEMEIYYLLFNNVEINIFANNKIEITCQDLKTKLKDQITKLLFEWTGKEWNVIINKKSDINSFKDQLIGRIKLSKDWQILEENFPEITVSDILFKN